MTAENTAAHPLVSGSAVGGGGKPATGVVRIRLRVKDPLSRAGVISFLEPHPEVALVSEQDDAEVVVQLASRLNHDELQALRRGLAPTSPPVVLILDELPETNLLTAVELKVVGVLNRMTLTSEELLRAVRAAATGGGALPPQLVGEVLNQLRQLRRGPVTRGNTRSPLTTREADVLRLLADGYDTVEIASRLQYSERTIKNIIHSLLQRLGLRNRPHAVAYAMRAGLID